MAWAFQSVTSVGTGTTATTNTTLPSTYGTGSLLLLVFLTEQSLTNTVNQSYTAIVNNALISTNSLYINIYYKFATSGSETAPTISSNKSGNTNYFIAAYSGLTSYDAISTLTTTSLPGAGTYNCTTGTLTTTAANDLVLNIFAGFANASNANTITYGTPSGTTSRLNSVGVGNFPFSLLLADENQINQGTSTARTSAAVKAGGSTGTSGQYQIAFQETNSGFFFFM